MNSQKQVELNCNTCNSTISISPCCKDSILISENKLFCHKCSKVVSVPLCCETEMLLLQLKQKLK